MTSLTHDHDQHISDTTDVLRSKRLHERWQESQICLALTEPRDFFAWKIHDLGRGILRISTRMSADCPSDFDEFWSDGFDLGRRYQAKQVTEMVRRAFEAGQESPRSNGEEVTL